MNLAVVTIVAPPISQDSPGCKVLQESLSYYGYRQVWLSGQPFKNFYELKIRDLGAGIRQLKNVTHVLYTDANDTVAAAPPEEVAEKFKQFNCPMVMSAGPTCFPDLDYVPNFQSASRWKFPNAGQWMADYETLLKYFDEHDAHYKQTGGRMTRDKKGWNRFADDQLLWTAALDERRVDFKLDTQCELFHSMWDTRLEDYVPTGGRIPNPVTKTTPSFFHANGRKDWRKQLCYDLAKVLISLRSN